MRVGDTTNNYSQWYRPSGQSGEQAPLEETLSAGTGISRSSLAPSSTPASISSGFWQLQSGESEVSDEKVSIESENAALEEEFSGLAHKSLPERIRDQYLSSHNLTEDDLAAMPAEARKAIEDEITKAINEQPERAADDDRQSSIFGI
ncbi:MAG: flagellar basal body-associated FliL family protein [Allorhizobium sp.]